MPARRKARSETGKLAGSMIAAVDAEAGAKPQHRAGILRNVGLVQGEAERHL